jgi:hypothetical protein
MSTRDIPGHDHYVAVGRCPGEDWSTAYAGNHGNEFGTEETAWEAIAELEDIFQRDEPDTLFEWSVRTEKAWTNIDGCIVCAAPDLLAALQQLMEWEGDDGGPGWYPDEDTQQSANRIWGDAWDAINKTGVTDTSMLSKSRFEEG